ncbi:putative phage holin [Rhodococcus marinonascens]|uniref:putative phage holin n=1 Tax=Rhodococcus marinonascens TaxID=38311 RepID=UPI0009355900|nr:hypothetical protein [Rhodococcus marinonascens]
MRAGMILTVLLGLLVIGIYDPVAQYGILVTALAVLSWTFTLLYATRSNWRITQAGKALMSTSLGLALLGTQIVSVWWLGNYRFCTDIRDAVVLYLVLTILYRILVLWKIQGRERAELKEER